MLEARLRLAQTLAREAGALLREGFGQPLEVGRKGTVVDLVTEYDLRSEELLVTALREAFPQDSVLSEESGSLGEGGLVWVIDPLDGTTNFAHGIPAFCVSIGLLSEGAPVLGVIYDPLLDELFHATEGGGAWLGDRRLSVSQTRSLDDSLLATGFPTDLRTNPDNNFDHFKALSLRTRAVRRIGSAALELAYVAAGRFDGYWELRLRRWDWAAGHLLVREAGGRVTHVDGSEDFTDDPCSVLAANGHLHPLMLQILKKASGKA